MPSPAGKMGTMKETLKRQSSKRRRQAKDKMRRQKSVWQRLLDSEKYMTMVLSYCGIFMLYGMTDELLGPTLIELSCLASKPLKSMSWMFFSHDLGLLCGTLIGGVIVSRVDVNMTIAVCLICNALCMAILPVMHKYSHMLFLVLLYGVFLGSPDTLSNVTLIETFGKEVAPYMQGVHFFYGFGAFISPLIARPFLRRTCTYNVNTTKFFASRNESRGLSFDNTTGYWIQKKVEHVQDNSSDVMYAYWIVSISHVPVIFGLSWLYFRKHLEHVKGNYRGSFVSLTADDDNTPVASLDLLPYALETTFWEKLQKNSKQRLLAVTVLCSIIMYLYEGMMAMYGGYVYSYAVKSVVSMTSDQGAYLTSMYWGFFSLGRFICILLAFAISPKAMLMGNVVGCLISSIILAAGHASQNAVYTGTCLLGLFLSSTAPTLISMAEQYVDLTAHTTSMLVVSAALGELTMPVIVGQAFEKIGAGVVPGVVLMICFLGFVGYCLLLTFDNDKAYEHASAIWKILQNFWCLGCESAQHKATLSRESSSDYPSSSETDPDSADMPKPDEIPKPTIMTDSVQPERDLGELEGQRDSVTDTSSNDTSASSSAASGGAAR